MTICGSVFVVDVYKVLENGRNVCLEYIQGRWLTEIAEFVNIFDESGCCVDAFTDVCRLFRVSMCIKSAEIGKLPSSNTKCQQI